MQKDIEHETPRTVELIEVIHTTAIRGTGTNKSPVRIVHQYWSKSGELLAEKDEY